MNIGILGCGDYLRWQTGDLKNSTKIKVAALYDPDTQRAQIYAEKLGGKVVESADAIFADSTIDAVCLFVPPWARLQLIKQAVAAGKHILTTKPLAPNLNECREIQQIVDDKVYCGVMYRRTGGAVFETLKQIFDSGEIGKLAIYKQDWLHHYPQWNQWALLPEKNGGPFMDAMIHNLNIARYLMDRPVTDRQFAGNRYAHPDLTCNDTEYMIVNFEGSATAYLFITWAADLAVYSTNGNDREHIDICYMITDQGWHVTDKHGDSGYIISASKLGETKTWPVKTLTGTPYDRFADSVQSKSALPNDIPGIAEAVEDIALLTMPK